MNLELEPEIKRKLAAIARECNLPLEKACEIVLTQFALNKGGRIYTGAWKAGRGLIFIVQWPFLTGLAKVKGEELERIGVK